MHDDELNRFKSDVHLLEYATERHGYVRDRDRSTRSSHVLSHPTSGDKVVVRLDRDGHWTYFSLRDDTDNGTVLDFVLHRTPHGSLGDARKELRDWLGCAPPIREEWKDLVRPAHGADLAAVARVYTAAQLAPNCPYLESRGLGAATVSSPRFAATWRVGYRGSVLFAHRDPDGLLTGFEIKGPGFTGFATGGAKTAWQSAARPDDRALVVAESALDAMSYYALYAPRGADHARYMSTGGSPGERQLEMLERAFARLPAGCMVVAAVDRDAGGDKLAAKLEALATARSDLRFARHSPSRDKDWNDVLQRRARDWQRTLDVALLRPRSGDRGHDLGR